MPALTILQMTVNNLEHIPHDLGVLFPNINSIQLNRNKFAHYDFFEFIPSLDRLISLPAIHSQTLRTLEALNNELRAFDGPINAPLLHSLNLSLNEFEGFFTLPPGSSLPQLENLNLRLSHITTIDPTILPLFAVLKQLLLTHNQLESIPPNLGESLPFLKVIWMGENRLTAIPVSITKLTVRSFLTYFESSFFPLCFL